MKKIKNFELIKLQEDNDTLKKNAEHVKSSINTKKDDIKNLHLSIEKIFDQESSVDLTILEIHKAYINKLQDDILRESILEKSIAKRCKEQTKLINENYGKSKLYEKLEQKNHKIITKNIDVDEQKNIDELSLSKKNIMSV